MTAPYPYSPIAGRTGFSLPGDARLAVYIGLNVEHYRPDTPSDADRPVPDPINQGLRDYGPRVGIWRLIEIFDDLGIPVSALTNSDVCRAYPPILRAGVDRGWAWVAHGQTNSVRVTGMSRADEEAHLREMHGVFADALPRPPVGWLGPRLSETAHTLDILGALGYRYVLDWCCDDQPIAMNTGSFLSVPYSQEVNDLGMYLKGFTGPEVERRILDQFEQLLLDAEREPRVLALPLHPYVAGQPWFVRYLRRALTAIRATDGVWFGTTDDIAAQEVPAGLPMPSS